MPLPLVWLLVGALIGLAGPAGAQTSAPMAVPKSDDGARDGRDGVWATRIEEPITRLQRARESLAAGDRTRAAAELRNAAAVLTMHGRPVDEPTRLALDDAAVSLRTLVDEVDRGAVASVDGLDPALARTDLTLVMLFEQGGARTGQFLEGATAAAIGRARWFAGRLMQGAATASDDFRQASEGVATALRSLGRCLAAGAATSPFGPAGPSAASAARGDDPHPVAEAGGTSSGCD
jgi:hypothetical protein